MKKFDLPEKFKKEVRALLEKDRAPQSILLTGSTESTRRNAAVYFAAALECEERNAPCLTCRACQKVLSGVHPDVYWVESTGKSDSVRMDDVRSIRETCYVVPNEGKRKVYLIPRAERLRPEAQNALLKVLEEPPRFSAFLLCSESRAALLPTVLSRVVELSLGDSRDDGITKKQEEKITGVCLAVCRAIAAGEEYALLKALVPLEKDRLAVARCADRLGELLLSALSGQNESEEAVLLGRCFSVPQLLKAYDVLTGVKEAVDRNANTSLLLCLFADGLCSLFSARHG